MVKTRRKQCSSGQALIPYKHQSVRSRTTVDPRQLSQFVVAARREHLGTAAAELGISEPALSRSVARLEGQLGVQVFDRVGRGLRLNAYGKLLLEHAERAFNELDLCEQLIRSLSAGGEQVTIGFIPSLGTRIVPKILVQAIKLDRLIRPRFFEGRGPALRTMLLNGTIDLYLGTLLFPDPAIDWQPAWEEAVAAVIPASHRLAARGELELRDLAQDPWLIARSAATTRRALVEAARTSGFAANIVFESDDFATIIGLVEAGHGVALLPEHCALPTHASVAIPIRPSPKRTIGVGHSKARPISEAAAAMRSIIVGEILHTFAPRETVER